jgi:hypothetical protein
LVDIEELRTTKIKKIRDKFAHNLLDNDDEYEDDEYKDDVLLDSKECVDIDTFIDLLSKLYICIHNDEKKFVKVYCPESKDEKSTEENEKIKKCVVISEDYQKIKDDEERIKSPNNGSDEWNIYELPEGVIQKSKDRILYSGNTLVEYLTCQFDKNIRIIIDGAIGYKKWINYSMILYKFGFKWVEVLNNGDVKHSGGPVFNIEDYNPKYNCNEKILKEPPIKYESNK